MATWQNLSLSLSPKQEPRLYPKARIARSFFRTHFGPEEQCDNRDFCMFAFEPNPSHIERHREMQQEYEKMGWRYHFIQGGVSDVDGNLTFYHTGDEYGYTTLKSSCRRRCDANHVPVYRLVDWIKQEIDGRLIPEPYGAGEVYDSGPRVVMKLDIEMMEWVVFPDLLLAGVMCNDITAIMGEFHLKPLWYLYPITFQGHASKTRGDTNFTIPKWEEARTLKEEWVTMIERNPNYNTTLDLRDDESYRTDGVSWPVPSNVNATI